MPNNKLAIIIPAYNESTAIASVIKSIPRALDHISTINIIVIDDGSTDITGKVAQTAGATVLRHKINRGVGVATVTGFAAAEKLGADIAVTMDADGQHDPAEISKLIEPIRLGHADIVVGTRLINPKGMPPVRLLGNRIMNRILQIFWGVYTTDSQSGYRAYSRKALQQLKLTTGGFEVCTEILYAAKLAHLKVSEAPIRTIYTDYSKTKGQNPITALLTFMRFVTRFITG